MTTPFLGTFVYVGGWSHIHSSLTHPRTSVPDGPRWFWTPLLPICRTRSPLLLSLMARTWPRIMYYYLIILIVGGAPEQHHSVSAGHSVKSHLRGMGRKTKRQIKAATKAVQFRYKSWAFLHSYVFCIRLPTYQLWVRILLTAYTTGG